MTSPLAATLDYCAFFYEFTKFLVMLVLEDSWPAASLPLQLGV
jgi:hypothetical protein